MPRSVNSKDPVASKVRFAETTLRNALDGAEKAGRLQDVRLENRRLVIELRPERK